MEISKGMRFYPLCKPAFLINFQYLSVKFATAASLASRVLLCFSW